MKNFKITTERVIIAVLLLILGITLFTCNNKFVDQNQQITKLQLDNQKLDSIVNERGQVILTQEAIVTQSQAAIRSLTDSIFALTDKQNKQIDKVIAYYRGVVKTEIKDRLVPYVDTSSLAKFADSIKQRCQTVIDYYEANTIIVPRTAADTSSADFTATLTATKTGIKIDSLVIIDTQDIRISTLKGGLFKKDTDGKRHIILGKKIRVDVLHSNKLGIVTKQNTVYYQPAKKLNLLPKAILIGTGIIIGTNINSP